MLITNQDKNSFVLYKSMVNHIFRSFINFLLNFLNVYTMYIFGGGLLFFISNIIYLFIHKNFVLFTYITLNLSGCLKIK